MYKFENLFKIENEKETENILKLNSGEYLCREGELPSSVFIFISGKLEILNNNYHIATITEPYTPVCELSYFLKIDKIATIRAAEDSILYRMDNSKLDDFFDKSSGIMKNILTNLMSRFVDMEESYIEILKGLEERVAQRTEKLNKANEELIELNRFKDEMIGMVAHDLRNPICVVNGYIEFILKMMKEEITEDVSVKLLKCMDISKGMNNMLTNLLDVTTIESGKINLDLKPENLMVLLIEAINTSQIIADKKNIYIKLQKSSELFISNVDNLRFHQIIENIINNGIKFAEFGTNIFVKIDCDEEFNYISIEDEGPGIPEEDKEKIFEQFYRTSNIPTNGEKSTGLGLAIVKKLVQMHDGKIFVENTEKGAKFIVAFPVLKD